MDIFPKLESLIDANYDEILRIRRELHTIPEIGLDTFRTADFISDTLTSNGIKSDRIGSKGTGIIARIGEESSPTVAIRADIDGIRIREETGLPYASTIDGNMHACGHDAHTAIALGSLLILRNLGHLYKGSVLFVFQPGEEGQRGSKDLIDHGLPKFDEILGLHVDPRFRYDEIGIREGHALAAYVYLRVKIIGKEGHAAKPHECIDPIYASSQFVNQVQAIVSRLNDPVHPIVLSFTSINSGPSYGRIPGEVKLDGTLRCFTQESVDLVSNGLERILQGLKSSLGIEYELYLGRDEMFPATYNDPQLTQKVLETVRRNSRLKVVGNCDPMMVSEDFSYYGLVSPSCFVFLGSSSEDYPKINHHNPRFQIDERCLKTGMRFFCTYVLGRSV